MITSSRPCNKQQSPTPFPQTPLPRRGNLQPGCSIMPPKKRALADIAAPALRPRPNSASQPALPTPSSPRSSPAAATALPLSAAAAPCTPPPPPLHRIAASILSLVERRGPDKSICPSEVARALFPGNWRAQMQAVRDVAWTLVAERKLAVTQVRRCPAICVFLLLTLYSSCVHVIVDRDRCSDRARCREGRRCATERAAPFGCG